MDNALRELYQEVILDHSRHPRHYGPLEGASHKAEGYNPLCGDRVTIYLRLDADGRVADIGFEGKGCAISQASASMMVEMLKGRTAAEADRLMQGFLFSRPLPAAELQGWCEQNLLNRRAAWIANRSDDGDDAARGRHLRGAPVRIVN